MKDFSEYYSEKEIIKYLCKIRIRYAQRKNKKVLLDKLTSVLVRKEIAEKEIRNKYDDEIESELKKILPPRKRWLTNGQRTYKYIIIKGTKCHVKIDTVDKNREILFKTVRKYINQKPDLEFVINLKKFIADIKESIEGGNYQIQEPDILPEIKEKNKNKLKYDSHNGIKTECRPISRFGLKDRIILSITNKFFTELFDGFFEESALAFRAVIESESHKILVKHHNAIDKILEFRHKYKDKQLYVAECDMKKFYDSVNHKICITAFNNLIDKTKLVNPSLELSGAISIFHAYLKCYSFRENVLTKDEKYWREQKDKNGNSINGIYPWIKEEIEKSEYYKENINDRIGVPQGGALSGLIANMVLDNADKQLKGVKDLFYVRYCDDMILMHENEEICRLSIEEYEKSINNLLLFNHNFKNEYSRINKNHYSKKGNKIRVFKTKKGDLMNHSFEYSIKPFWESKSKGPYKWGEINLKNNSFPWIGFVGYEIHYNGETRIRKRSLKKEIEKQKKVVKSIVYVIKKAKKVRNNTVLRSAYEKLNGMSVGRVKLYNFKTCQNQLCWTDGFQSLTFNEYSKSQLKTLDRNKYEQIHILKKQLGRETVVSEEADIKGELYSFHKPFSYYYQAGEKRRKRIH
jgi:hypothetical protein